MKKLFTKTLISSALLAAAGAANAAAFQLAEISTSGLGRAYAGEAAIADNAAAVATNPALMSVFTRPVVSVGAIHVRPDVDVEATTLYGTQAATSANANNVVNNGTVPNLYGIYPINDKFAVGGGINVNYGFATEYDTNYSAGFIGGKTDLKTINFNLSGSYKITDALSFGLGLNAVYADAVVERRVGVAGLALAGKAKAAAMQYAAAGDLAQAQYYGALAQQAAAVSPSTLLRKIEGKEWGFSWNAGLMWQVNERNRFGIAYHSKVDIKFKGEYSDAGAAILGPLAQGNEPGALTLPLPAYWEFSGFHQVTDQLALHYSWKYTEWSKLERLKATGSNTGKVLFNKTEKFRDSSRLALGATYNVNDALTLRAGIAYDESAASDHHSISIPDTDRVWYSLGATYKFTDNLSMDAGFAHLRGSKNHFKETESGIVTDIKTKAKANLYGLNINYRF